MNDNTERAPEPRVDIDVVIGANIHTLMWRAHDTQTAISRMLQITQGALSHKLRGRRPWTSTEIDIMARHYDVSHSALFTKLPDLDSNQEPAGFESAPPQREIIYLEDRRANHPAHHRSSTPGESQIAVVSELPRRA